MGLGTRKDLRHGSLSRNPVLSGLREVESGQPKPGDTETPCCFCIYHCKKFPFRIRVISLNCVLTSCYNLQWLGYPTYIILYRHTKNTKITRITDYLEWVAKIWERENWCLYKCSRQGL